jgi:hypothetical protein
VKQRYPLRTTVVRRLVAETVTVTGESPVVDTQSIRRQMTIASDTLTSIPTARSWAATAVLIPAIVTQSGATADLQVTPQMTVFGGSGGRANEGRMQVDGLNTGASLNGGGVSTYLADIANAQEVSLTTSGGLGEAEVGGPTLSIVPKSGGNTIKGSFYAAGVSGRMVGSNYGNALKVAGLATPGKLLKLWDVTGGLGGPIRKDRLSFFFTARSEGQYRSIPGSIPTGTRAIRRRFSTNRIRVDRRRARRAGRSGPSGSRCRRHRDTNSISTGTSRFPATAQPTRAMLTDAVNRRHRAP